MINPNDNNIKWTEKADMEMALTSMIDLLYKGELLNEYSERLDRHQPFNHYKELYKENKELLNSIVEIFFTGTFKPSDINKQKTNEFYMWITINAIFYIVWYNNIENSKPRGYEKANKELNKARYYLSGFTDISSLNCMINFPNHRNETIEKLDEFFTEHKRTQQGKKIITAIKEHFNIKVITPTKHKKMINANKRMLEKIKKDQNLTDEWLHKHPFLGQLQTKI